MTNHETNDKSYLGFWIYLMTDLIMFAVLFTAFAVLRNNTFGGPGGGELFSLSGALTETMILLTSTFTCGLAMLAMHGGKKNQMLFWLGVTFVLGLTFICLELNEFSHMIAEGNSFQRNAFLSSFFTLVGTHGLHITFGLLWIFIAMIEVWSRGLTDSISSKLMRFSLFWHFLDVVWIFIFTIVYLMAKT